MQSSCTGIFFFRQIGASKHNADKNAALLKAIEIYEHDLDVMIYSLVKTVASFAKKAH